jgi:hypothetical protein
LELLRLPLLRMDQAYPDKLDDKITEELWARKSNSPITLQLSYAHACKPR